MPNDELTRMLTLALRENPSASASDEDFASATVLANAFQLNDAQPVSEMDHSDATKQAWTFRSMAVFALRGAAICEERLQELSQSGV